MELLRNPLFWVVVAVVIVVVVVLLRRRNDSSETATAHRAAASQSGLLNAANSVLMHYHGVVGQKNEHSVADGVDVWLGDDNVLRIKATQNGVSLRHLVGMNIAVLSKSGRKICDVLVTPASVGGDSVVRVVLPVDKLNPGDEVGFSRLTAATSAPTAASA